MPFTLAHPALVLPLSNTKFRFSITALIIGSIVPDFEFFLQMREVENIGHHWYGILFFDVPVAWLFCYLYHGVLKNSMVANLPLYYRQRLTPFISFNWIQFAATNKLKVTVSILIGVFTHIFWDGFTHADGFFVQQIPLLSKIFQFHNWQIALYYGLQILFSLVGMLYVYLAIAKLPIDKKSMLNQHKSKYFWPLFFLVFIIIFLVRIIGWPHYNNFWSIVMAFMGGFTYAWIISTLLVKQFKTFKKLNHEHN